MSRPTLEELVDRYCAAVLSQEQSHIVGVSGGPNSGKSSLVKLLSKRGVVAIDEVATRLINKHGHAIRADATAFQILVIEEQLMAEIPLRESGQIAVGDRGLFDSVGYFRVRGDTMPEHVRVQLNRIATLSAKPLYRVVFMLETIDMWDDDGIRDEDLEFSRRLFKDMTESYCEYGEEVVRVPVFTGTREESSEQRLQQVVQEMAKRRLLI